MPQSKNAKLVFAPKDFQREFYDSTALFPGNIGPWGSGKTICAIMKGMVLSMLYPGNEGLIIRRRFNALIKSTIRDFTDWTGLKVSEQKQYIDIPGTGSRINFSHCDSLPDFREAVQGMNLGWAYIEQADELEDGSVFDEIRGRLRRILTPNDSIQGQLIDLGVMSERVPDFRVLDGGIREEIEKAVIEKLKLPVRQIIVIANAQGHNWVWKRWHPDNKTLSGYHGVIGVPFENAMHIPSSTIADWKRLKTENPRKYNRCVMNSFEDYEYEGSFYSDLMSDAMKEKRVELDDLYDVTIPVYTFWDLGVGNATVIWFAQFIGQSIRLIDYYQASGQGMDALSHILDDKRYRYEEHWLPHDARQRMQGSQITTRLDVLRRLRPNENIYVTPKTSLEDGIEAVRGLLNRCRFGVKCEKGVECLNKYHRKLDERHTTEETTVYLDKPAKEYSDGADAFRYLAIAYRYMISNSATRAILGDAGPVLDVGEVSSQDEYHPLPHFTGKGRIQRQTIGART